MIKLILFIQCAIAIDFSCKIGGASSDFIELHLKEIGGWFYVRKKVCLHNYMECDIVPSKFFLCDTTIENQYEMLGYRENEGHAMILFERESVVFIQSAW